MLILILTMIPNSYLIYILLASTQCNTSSSQQINILPSETDVRLVFMMSLNGHGLLMFLLQIRVVVMIDEFVVHLHQSLRVFLLTHGVYLRRLCSP